MRLSSGKARTVIDLSELGLDQIEETDNVIKIGAMCTLRQIEQCEALKEMYGDGIAESVRHIVGVQFRNQATVGGSIYGRFGFSDVLTAFLALDTFVELYDGGIIRLSEFVDRKPDKDILLSVIVRKSKRQFRYESIRQTKTDFPVLTCAVSSLDGKGYAVIGARPGRAVRMELPANWEQEEDCRELAVRIAQQTTYGSNMRASAAYRKHLAEVLLVRSMKKLAQERRGH